MRNIAKAKRLFACCPSSSSSSLLHSILEPDKRCGGSWPWRAAYWRREWLAEEHVCCRQARHTCSSLLSGEAVQVKSDSVAYCFFHARQGVRSRHAVAGKYMNTCQRIKFIRQRLKLRRPSSPTGTRAVCHCQRRLDMQVLTAHQRRVHRSLSSFDMYEEARSVGVDCCVLCVMQMPRAAGCISSSNMHMWRRCLVRV